MTQNTLQAAYGNHIQHIALVLVRDDVDLSFEPNHKPGVLDYQAIITYKGRRASFSIIDQHTRRYDFISIPEFEDELYGAINFLKDLDAVETLLEATVDEVDQLSKDEIEARLAESDCRLNK